MSSPRTRRQVPIPQTKRSPGKCDRLPWKFKHRDDLPPRGFQAREHQVACPDEAPVRCTASLHTKPVQASPGGAERVGLPVPLLMHVTDTPSQWFGSFAGHASWSSCLSRMPHRFDFPLGLRAARLRNQHNPLLLWRRLAGLFCSIAVFSGLLLPRGPDPPAVSVHSRGARNSERLDWTGRPLIRWPAAWRARPGQRGNISRRPSRQTQSRDTSRADHVRRRLPLSACGEERTHYLSLTGSLCGSLSRTCRRGEKDGRTRWPSPPVLTWNGGAD